jgi:hypothetical protein
MSGTRTQEEKEKKKAGDVEGRSSSEQNVSLQKVWGNRIRISDQLIS